MEERKNANEILMHCCNCDCEMSIGEAVYFEGEAYCRDCFEEETTICIQCGSRIFEDDSEGDDDTPLCGHCFERYYNRCDECGRLILQEEEYFDEYEDRTLCYHCMKQGAIQNYSYKPDPIFYGTDSNLYLGVELEIDDGDGSHEDAKEILRIANAEASHIYIKHDGSLDSGFEIVTHPMTLQYHMEVMPWKEVMEKALNMGYRSHKSATCGLHCHVNRTFFGEDYEQQEENIGKVLFLVEKYWEELLRFSRRTKGQMSQWAARYGFKEKPNQVMDQAKNSILGRYACVNLQNWHTIEFRMWRGTLKYNTLIATLQMVENLCKTARAYSEEELQNRSWWRFVSEISETELITYLKERRLYINEPVEMEEEI